MTNNEKLAEFVKADWDAKKRSFDAAIHSPFPWGVSFLVTPEPAQPPPQPSPKTTPPGPTPENP